MAASSAGDEIVSSGPLPRHPPGTLAQLLDQAIRKHAERLAILAADRAPLSYAGLGRQFDLTARVLAGAGYGRSSRVGVALPDGPEFAVAVLAVGRVVTCAPLNLQLDQEAVSKLLSALRIDALVVADGEGSPAERAACRAGVALLRLRATPDNGAGSFALDAGQRYQEVPLELPGPADIAFVSHTSGTTSSPKIVPYEQWRVAEAARNRVDAGGLSSSDRIMLLTPLFSLGAIRRSLLPPLLIGGAVVCPVTLDARVLVDMLAAFAPTQFVAAPATLMALLAEVEGRVERPQHSLRVIHASYSQLPADVHDRLQAAFRVPVMQSYGMTEAGSIAQTPLPPERVPSRSVGRPAFAEVAIADAGGQFLGADDRGEILVRGPEVFAGYENDVEANRSAFRDGWFRTGDLGRIDRDGFLYLEGRIKDVINRGGAKVSPREVEDVLALHPRVAEAAVFAIPHPTLGEDVAAAIVPRQPGTVAIGDLRRYLRGKLTAYKVPARIFAVATLPRSALGKIDRVALVRLANQTAGVHFEPPRDGEESAVAKIFAEVLEVAGVGRQDGFFDLGGDSLRGVRVLARVEETFGFSVMLDVLFDHPTVAGLAAEIRRLSRRTIDSTTLKGSP